MASKGKEKKETATPKLRKLQVNKETINDLSVSDSRARDLKGGKAKIISLSCPC